MSKSQISNIFYGALKSLFSGIIKITVIAIGFILKIAGLILTKTSEAIEKAILQKNI
jgi:hypothetical protein